MRRNRRDFLKQGVGSVALSSMIPALSSVQAQTRDLAQKPLGGTASKANYLPTITPDGVTLDFKLIDGVKVFHLTAEDVDHQFAPDLKGLCFGYNGRVHGPTIEAVEGDRVRIYVTNRLESPTTVHWHGMHVPSGMDGVGGLSQRPIQPGETFKYEFDLKQHGAFMYHSHHDEMVQMALGLMGMFIVHPLEPTGPAVDRDYVFMLSEWALKPGLLRPDPYEMNDFNLLTLNGKAFPGTSPIHAKRGERVRIRLGNLSAMDHHPMHLHGHTFLVTETDGGRIQESAQWPETTVLVPVGSTRTIEFIADNPGDWAFHCHMTHHTMTQMGHGIPNLVNVDQATFDAKVAAAMPSFASSGSGHMGGDEDTDMGMQLPRNSAPMFGGRGPHGYIPMGGMFTILKVRDSNELDAEWYEDPGDTTARPATESELLRDGIDPSLSSKTER